MNRVNAAVPVLLCILLYIAACGKVMPGERNDTEESEYVNNTVDNGNYYVFEDVEGNEYKAPLLDDVPRCTYDFSGMETDEESGFKYFPEENGVTALQGIDVSEFQGEEIDWKLVKQSGVDFAVIRLGYRAYGEGGELVPDAMYEKNITGALDAGLIVGVYFFSQATSNAEAMEEAEYVLELIRPYRISGPVVYDTEEIRWDDARTDENTVREFTEFCRVFCDQVREAGYSPMIYSNMKWMAFSLDMEALSEYDFWYADYHDTPQCPYNFKMWQYSESGVVPGIHTNVDLNLWFQEDQGNEME